MRAALFLAATAEAAHNQQFQTVINLLNQLKSEGVDEQNREQTNWAKLKVWCENAIGESKNEMEEQTRKVDEYTGKVAGQNANIVKYTADRDTAAEGEVTMKDDLAVSLAQRELANGAFEANNAELTGILGQVDEVIVKLKGLSDTAAVEPSLLQQTQNILSKYTGVSSSASTAIQLLQQPVQGTDYAYQVKSGGVVEILEDLKQQFTKEQQDATETESREVNAYEMKKQECEAKLATFTANKENAISAFTDAEEKRGFAQGKLDAAKLALKQASEFNSNTNKDCMGYALAYDEASKTRAAEKAAIEEALEILQSGAAETGAANLKDATEADLSFLQVNAKVTVSEPQRDAARFLKHQAETLDSKILMQLAQVATADPFAKVKDLVRDLIAKLQDEVANASDKQMWCEQEMAKNQRKLDASEEKKLNAQATLDAHTANLANAKDSLAELKTQLADLRQSVAEGEQQRVAESKDNARIIKESNEGVEAVEKAIEVLETVFSRDEAALVQEQQPAFGGERPSAVPQASGAAAGGNNVIAALEELGAKMRTHAQAVAAEESEAATNWRKSRKEMETDITIKETNERNNKSEIASFTTELSQAKDDLKLSMENEKAATKYRQESLEPQCVQTAVSFEERNKKRQAEIESLQQALEILSQPAA